VASLSDVLFMVSRNAFLIFGLVLLLVVASCSFLSRQSSEEEFGPLPDFASFQVVDEKKRAFFDYFSTLVAAVNSDIKEDRSRLEALQNTTALSADDNEWLTELAEQYDVTLSAERQDSSALSALLNRVDQIPESLVLSQAAIESAWGTSRFAQEGRNFFGQWCYTKGCGLVPAARKKKASHEVKVFDSPLHSVQAYFNNVNRNRAYAPLRALRAQARAAGEQLSGCRLSEGLKRYSELGEKYIAQVKSVIRINGLEKSKHCQKKR